MRKAKFLPVVIVGIAGIFLSYLYFVKNFSLPRIAIPKPCSTIERPDRHHNVKCTGPAANTTLTFYPGTQLPVAPDHVMLVKAFDRKGRVLTFKGCDHRCVVTNDTAEADLLFVDILQIEPHDLPSQSQRKKDQTWMFFSMGPPTYPRLKSIMDRPELKNQINWTSAIFSDATFPGMKFNGLLEPAGKPAEKDFDAIYESKVHSVAWFTSHCRTASSRLEYVKRMRTRIDVHIYGTCGNMTCGRKYRMAGDKNECMDMLSKKYKFYLAFENSFCLNYVTEKFSFLFRNPKPPDVIPVVRGAGDYKKLFDPKILVNAADFQSPEELGDYLSDLGSDKARYVAMLKQKSRYRRTASESLQCVACRSLHNKDIPRQSYVDIYSFWTQNRCYNASDLEGV